MPTSVTMPALGESVTEGTVTRWLKQEGEQVEVDEPLLEVSTDKVDTEIPSPAAGVLTKILVAEDETVEVGAELAVIGGGDGAAAPEPKAEPEPEPAQEEAPAEPEPAQEEAAAPQQEEQPAPSSDDSGGSGGGEGTSVTMPALGESVTEGTVTRWLKAVGEQVTADEPLLEVSTDKVDTEIPAPVSGTLLSIAVNEDETVDVGAELVVIGTGGGGAAAPAESAPAESAPAAAEKAPEPEPEPEPAPAEKAPEPKPAPAAEPPAAQAAAPEAPAAQAPAGDGGGS
jgi:pyruvate dehydrogenase E2 component (dihydrolipoamide acetyltransferase)